MLLDHNQKITYCIFFTLLNGIREEIPQGTPKRLSTLIQHCWAQPPKDRPRKVEQVINELQNCLPPS